MPIEGYYFGYTLKLWQFIIEQLDSLKVLFECGLCLYRYCEGKGKNIQKKFQKQRKQKTENIKKIPKCVSHTDTSARNNVFGVCLQLVLIVPDSSTRRRRRLFGKDDLNRQKKKKKKANWIGMCHHLLVKLLHALLIANTWRSKRTGGVCGQQITIDVDNCDEWKWMLLCYWWNGVLLPQTRTLKKIPLWTSLPKKSQTEILKNKKFQKKPNLKSWKTKKFQKT